MKKRIRNTSILLLTAIYCLTLGVNLISPNQLDFQQNKQEKHYSNTSQKLSLHTIQSESSVSDFNDFQTPVFKISFSKIWAIPQTTKQLYQSVFSQYTSSSINVLINHRKSDIIFPFHYFW